jgi:hypothetical protein
MASSSSSDLKALPSGLPQVLQISSVGDTNKPSLPHMKHWNHCISPSKLDGHVTNIGSSEFRFSGRAIDRPGCMIA